MKTLIVAIFFLIIIKHTFACCNRDTVITQACNARGGLPHFFSKIETHDQITIGFLGGSITLAPGYRVLTEKFLTEKWPSVKFTTINAGVGGTGSDLGAFRVKKDVLIHHPDLVFVEFAVNDANTDSLRVCNAIEGIIRQIKADNANTDICMLYSFNEQMLPSYREGHIFKSVRYMEMIANHYRIPSVNFAFDVLSNLDSGKFMFRPTNDSRITDKLVFTNDGTHPTMQGHKLYADILSRAINHLSLLRNRERYHIPRALYQDNMAIVYRSSPSSLKIKGHWQSYTNQDSIADKFVSSFPDMIYLSSVDDSLEFSINGKQFGLEDVIGPYSNAYSLTIDGHTTKIQRFDKYCTLSRRNYFLIDIGKPGSHRIKIKLSSDVKAKDEIMSSNHILETLELGATRAYIGSLMWR